MVVIVSLIMFIVWTLEGFLQGTFKMSL